MRAIDAREPEAAAGPEREPGEAEALAGSEQEVDECGEQVHAGVR